MAHEEDLDDLVDAFAVAERLGLAGFRQVREYRRRYPDFPAPVVDTARRRLWLRRDIEAWAEARRPAWLLVP